MDLSRLFPEMSPALKRYYRRSILPSLAFLLLACCDGDNAYPAFDEYGHGAMIADESIQYAPDMAAAAQEAVATMKKTIQVL